MTVQSAKHFRTLLMPTVPSRVLVFSFFTKISYSCSIWPLLIFIMITHIMLSMMMIQFTFLSVVNITGLMFIWPFLQLLCLFVIIFDHTHIKFYPLINITWDDQHHSSTYMYHLIHIAKKKGNIHDMNFL